MEACDIEITKGPRMDPWGMPYDPERPSTNTCAVTKGKSKV